jgi:o-succinylbenzoate synthase
VRAGHDGEAMETPLVVREITLFEVALPLVRPFRTSFGEETHKHAILVRVGNDGPDGWGECVASEAPRYSEEWLEGAWAAIERFLGPAILEAGAVAEPGEVAARLAWVRGHRMAKAALEAAIIDAWLRRRRRALRDFLGGTRERVPCGVSVGIASSFEALMEEVRGYLDRGYRRVKLKIEPGRDVEIVRAVREALPDTPLSVDGNAAYTLDDLATFAELDELDLVMIEQPLHHEDLTDHAKLQEALRTPICLDESIRSARDVVLAADLGACRIVNIKPGRVGGLLEAKRIHDTAAALGIPVWIGGMLETGVGRAANLALAALPGVTLPGDTSGSDRYFARDLTDPFVVEPDGTMAVPAGPGVGVEVHTDRLAECTVRKRALTS